MVILDFWSSVRCFGTHLAITLLISSFSYKIWCADALRMLNWLATSCNVTLRTLFVNGAEGGVGGGGQKNKKQKKTTTTTTKNTNNKNNIRHHCTGRVTASAGLPSLDLPLTLVLSSINCETQLWKVERDMQGLEKPFSGAFEKCGKVFHPLKAGI